MEQIGFINITPEDSSKLFKWNLFLGVFHLITSIAIFVITDKNATVPVYYFFANDARGEPTWGPVPKVLFDSKIGYLSGVFLLLASIDHFLVATLLRKTYEKYLGQNRNPIRWIEYSISASLMHVQIAQLSAVFDFHSLILIFGCTMTTMLFGNEQEIANALLWGQPRSKTLRPFWIGCIPHIFNWAIIGWHFFHAVTYGPPAFVWAIIFILFFLDATFAANMWLQQKEVGPWKKYVYGEIVFCILSLTAKQLLAWINFGGTASI